MYDVEVAIKVYNCHSMRSRLQREVLVHITTGIPAELDPIIPDLHLAYG
jgi:hypothetical protein